jgi:amino acid transporter
MQKTASSMVHGRWRSAIVACVIAMLIAITPLRSAQAYVDPNSVGPLYQFLFPVLVAVASGFAVLKRTILRAWNRLLGRVAEEEPTGQDAE